MHGIRGMDMWVMNGVLFVFDLHYHQIKHMQDIFINSFRTCFYSHGTYPNPFLNFG